MNIKYCVIDVDGTMTDGSIYYDENGNELKKFNTRDAAGFFVAKALDIKTIVITGRKCEATLKRLGEMKVDYLYQGVKDKYTFLKDFMELNGIDASELAYIGDDLNDYDSMQLAGYKACPADAATEIINIADYVSSFKGGEGVVRDCIKSFLSEEEWYNGLQKAYGLKNEIKTMD